MFEFNPAHPLGFPPLGTGVYLCGGFHVGTRQLLNKGAFISPSTPSVLHFLACLIIILLFCCFFPSFHWWTTLTVHVFRSMLPSSR